MNINITFQRLSGKVLFSDSQQRSTAKRRAALVASVLEGTTSVLSGRLLHGPTVADLEDQYQRLLLGPENALRTRPRDEEALKHEPLKRFNHKIGGPALDLDILKGATKNRHYSLHTRRAAFRVAERRPCRMLVVDWSRAYRPTESKTAELTTDDSCWMAPR